ncbi:hypothetical protein C1D11_07190 [Mycobacterium tuberculosis variant bovis]|nr:hypothetical protein C1D11_07190 [Mycobacterium tuberculosis variant bovis]
MLPSVIGGRPSRRAENLVRFQLVEHRLCQVNRYHPKHRDACGHSRRAVSPDQSLSMDPGVVLDT